MAPRTLKWAKRAGRLYIAIFGRRFYGTYNTVFGRTRTSNI